MDQPIGDVTLLIRQASSGDDGAKGRLAEMMYEALRGAAKRQLGRAAREHTLQPTALVHEAFVKLCGAESVSFNDRQHFFAVAARAMRQVLINHARERAAVKRGGGERPGELVEDAVGISKAPIDVLDLNAALEALAELDERKHQIVELRFFGGLSVDEVAEVLGVSKTTVESEWRAARAWIAVRLES